MTTNEKVARRKLSLLERAWLGLYLTYNSGM